MQQVVKKLDEKADNDGQTPERLVTKPVEKQMPKVEQSPQDTSQIQQTAPVHQELNGSEISSVNHDIVFIDKSGVIEKEPSMLQQQVKIEMVQQAKPKRKPRDEITFEDVENAILLIQRQSRVFLNCRRFRQSLYRLILLKNIVETKVHKENLQLLFAFEQFIMNTEDGNEPSEIVQDEDAGENPNTT